MKSLKLLFIPLLLTVSSCADNTGVHIMVPTGAPAVAFYNFSTYSNFETNSDPKNVITHIRNNSNYDIVVAPTQGGIQAINRDIKEQGYSDFKIASTITFGNFYLAATGNDLDKTLNDNDKVVLFNQNEVPDKLFRALYSSLLDKLSIIYVKGAGDATSVLKNGSTISEGGETIPVDYVLMAEPALSGALSVNKNASIYQDMQALYKSTFPGNEIMQASVFVNTKNVTRSQKIKTALTKLEADIEAAIFDPSNIQKGFGGFNISESMLNLKFGIPSSSLVIKSMQNNKLGLGYKNAYQNKNSIDKFLKTIAPAIGETNEEIYYK